MKIVRVSCAKNVVRSIDTGLRISITRNRKNRPTDRLPRASIFALSISTRIETRWPNSFVRRGLTRAFSFVFLSLVICHTRFYSRAMLEKKNWYMTIYSNIYNTRIMKLGSQEVRETVWPWSHFFLFHTNRSQEELTVFTELNAITMNEPPLGLATYIPSWKESKNRPCFFQESRLISGISLLPSSFVRYIFFIFTESSSNFRLFNVNKIFTLIDIGNKNSKTRVPEFSSPKVLDHFDHEWRKNRRRRQKMIGFWEEREKKASLYLYPQRRVDTSSIRTNARPRYLIAWRAFATTHSTFKKVSNVTNNFVTIFLHPPIYIVPNGSSVVDFIPFRSMEKVEPALNERCW